MLHSRSRGSLLISLLVFGSFGTTRATPATPMDSPDWPQLWGPRVTAAVEGGLQPGPVSLRELWRRPLGSGFSGVSLDAERAYTGESDGTLDHAVALDVHTGKTVWKARLGETYRGHDGSRDGPISTPAVGQGRVFFPGPFGQLVALEARTGRELWRVDLGKELQAKMPFYGFGASPTLAGEHVILQVGTAERSGLAALDAASGRLVWSALPSETKGDSAGYTMAVATDLLGEPQLVAMGHDRVFAVRPQDGQLLWSHALAETEEPTRAVLPLDGSHLLVSRFRDSRLLRLAREGTQVKTTEVWTSPRLKGSYSPNVHLAGLVFGFGGQYLLCLDAATGEPRWRQKVNAGTLIRIGGHLLVLGEQSGLLRVVEATGDAYRQTAEAVAFNAGAQSSTGPSFADGRVLVRNTEEVVAFALEGPGARAESEKVRQ